MKPDYRHRAREHVKAAKALLAKPGEDNARYACLELRMGIESLTYQTLETYLSEAPNSVMAQWTPKKVMDELLEVDPRADKSVTLFVGIEETPGVESKDMKYLGEDKRFTVKWGNKAHNALGNFLHEPTIADFKAGKDSSDAAARKKAQEIIDELDGILKTTLFNVNFGQFVSFSCACGFAIRRKAEVLDPAKPVACGGCGRQYIYEAITGGKKHAFHADRFEYVCESCHQKSYVDAHTIAKLPTVVCDCGAKARVSIQYVLTKIADNKNDQKP